MKRYYIKFKVCEDDLTYCGYVQAESKLDAIDLLKEQERDVTEIVMCGEGEAI